MLSGRISLLSSLLFVLIVQPATAQGGAFPQIPTETSATNPAPTARRWSVALSAAGRFHPVVDKSASAGVGSITMA
jgi:hypothetical protein